MKKIFMICAALTILISPAFSQGYKGRGRIKGIITDTEGQPLEGVKIKLFSLRSDAGFEIESEKNGEWRANWIRGGTWYIDFTHVGYEPRKISIQVLELRSNPPIEITMKKIEGIALTEKIVEAMKAANKIYDEGKYEEAIAAYEEILTEFPDAFIINQNIGNAYFALGDYDKAIEFYEKLLEKKGDHSSTFILVGNSYINKKDNEHAMEWYSKVNVEDIEDVIALYNIGILFFNSGNYDKAITYLKRAIEIDNQLSDGFYQLGMSYLASGQNLEAIEVLEKFIELEPESDKTTIAKSIIETLTKKREQE